MKVQPDGQCLAFSPTQPGEVHTELSLPLAPLLGTSGDRQAPKHSFTSILPGARLLQPELQKTPVTLSKNKLSTQVPPSSTQHNYTPASVIIAFVDEILILVLRLQTSKESGSWPLSSWRGQLEYVTVSMIREAQTIQQ